MSWSYSGDPSSSDKDAVRFLVQDTDTNDQLVQDEEINWALTQGGGIYEAAALIAGTIAAQFARMADKETVGKVSVSYTKRAEQYKALADDLKKQASTKSAPIPYAGGISKADVETQELNEDRVKPSFTVGQFDNPRNVSQDDEDLCR